MSEMPEARVTLDEDAVVAFLRDHPATLHRILEGHPDLLDRGRPGLAEDGVVDLQSVLIDRLRGRVDHLDQQQRAFMAASHANQSAQQRTFDAVLFLLESDSLGAMVDAIGRDLPVLLDVEAAQLLVEDGEGRSGRIGGAFSGVRVVPQGTIERLLGPDQLRLEDDIVGEPVVYGGKASCIYSQALARVAISERAPSCLLALGSQVPDAFSPDMRDDLVAFTAKVVGRLIRSWLLSTEP